LIKHR